MRQPGLHAAPGGGLVSAAAAILLYHVANPQLLVFDYDHWDFLQMALFVVVGLITAKLVRDARLQRRLAMTDDLTGRSSSISECRS